MNGLELVHPTQDLVQLSTSVGSLSATLALLACAAIFAVLCLWK